MFIEIGKEKPHGACRVNTATNPKVKKTIMIGKMLTKIYKGK